MTTSLSLLSDELVLITQNLTRRGWTRGDENHQGRVTAAGAVRTCEGLHPGHTQVISSLMFSQGLDLEWNDKEAHDISEVAERIAGVDTSEQALAQCFGPGWREIAWLIRRAAEMTPQEVRRLAAAYRAAVTIEPLPAPCVGALLVAFDAAVRAETSRDGTIVRVMGAASDASEQAWTAAQKAARNDVRNAAQDAAAALVVADLIGQNGLTKGHIDALLQSWVDTLGPIGEARF